MANRLFVFDMDGTLLIKTTACLEIAKATATLDQRHMLETQFANGELDAFGSRNRSARCGECWTNDSSEQHLKRHPSWRGSRRSRP